MHCEVFQSTGVVRNAVPKPLPLCTRSSSGFWNSPSDMNEKGEGKDSLRSEAVEFMLSWASRLHPSDVKLDRETISQGYVVAELLCFLSREYFDEGFVEQLHTDDDQTMHGKVRRNELIRQQIRNFYLSKCKHDLENAPMFFVPATEIAEKDEDALMSFLVIIYGIVIILKSSANNVFDQMLQTKSPEFREYFKRKEKEFIEQMNGNDQTNYADVIRTLRSKITEKEKLIVQLRDKVSHLEFDLEGHKDELNRYAENNIINQELQRKIENAHQLEKQIKEQEELVNKLEADLRERRSTTDSLTTENSKIKFQLEEVKAELQDIKDEKSEIQRRLVMTEARSREFEDKYTRIREENCKQPSKRDYDALMERNMKNLAIINDYEQKEKSLESYRTTLSTRELQLEQAKKEYDEILNRLLTSEQTNRELRNRLKDIEELRPNGFDLPDKNSVDVSSNEQFGGVSLELEVSEDLSPPATSEEFVRLKVEFARLQSDKQILEEELRQQTEYAEKEKKETLNLVAKLRNEKEQLAIKLETTENDCFKLKSSLGSSEDRCKRLKHENTALMSQNAVQEQTIKRAGVVISEYVCQNEDGSSAGLSGGEVLQLKADVKRLEEQLRQKRSQSDAYRHISTEEQRLITTEWYEQASQHLRQKYLASSSSASLNNGNAAGRVSNTPDQFNYTTHSHLSDLQSSVMSSARSTPTHPNTSTNSTPGSSMANSVNAETSGVMGQVRSFLGLQRDTFPRTPTRWGESPNAQPIQRPNINPTVQRPLV